MRGTGQPLCSQTRTATCSAPPPAALELWLLLQLNSLLRVPYVRMHFRPSDQASWVVASHRPALAAGDPHVPGSPPPSRPIGVREVRMANGNMHRHFLSRALPD